MRLKREKLHDCHYGQKKEKTAERAVRDKESKPLKGHCSRNFDVHSVLYESSINVKLRGKKNCASKQSISHPSEIETSCMF